MVASRAAPLTISPGMMYDGNRALELLRLGTGRHDSEFREGQEGAIRHIVEGRRRLLVVQKTGWGKSFVYFIATKLLREVGSGPALLVSPLLALMRNQIAAAERMEICAVRIASDNQEDWQGAEECLRRDEQRQMREYVRLESGHMEFLIRALDGDPGALQPPALPLLPAVAEVELVREAVSFLRGTSLPIDPRKRWPAGGMPRYDLHGHISREHRAEPGRALCIWGDAGWGGLVRDGKYRDGHFADALVRACASLVAQWAPRPAPEWVTCIPSRRHPHLVPDFAARLAMHMGVPFHRALAKIEDRAEQKSMANSTQQARNVDASLALSQEPLPRGPVLLVDDMVDSRWTLTVAAWLLRSKGSGEVWPLALAGASRG